MAQRKSVFPADVLAQFAAEALYNSSGISEVCIAWIEIFEARRCVQAATPLASISTVSADATMRTVRSLLMPYVQLKSKS